MLILGSKLTRIKYVMENEKMICNIIRIFDEIPSLVFDLIFLDPQFNKNYLNLLLPKIISDFSKTGTLIYIEESNFNFSDYDKNLKLLKETSSGNSFGRLFEVT